MNAFSQYYSPINAFFGGYRLGDAMSETEERERLRRKELADRNALAQMGQGEYLTGLEGVEGPDGYPGVRRPDELKRLYRQNPQAALEYEKMQIAPHLLDLQARKQIAIEKGKIDASFEPMRPLLQRFMGGQGGQPANAFARQFSAPSAVGMTTDDGMLPPGGGVLENPEQAGAMERALSGQGLEDLSGQRLTMKISKEGPAFTMEDLSPLERQLKVGEFRQKGEGVRNDSLRTTETLTAGSEARKQQAHERVRNITNDLNTLGLRQYEMTPSDFANRANGLMQELAIAKRERDSLMPGGKNEPPSSVAELTPEEKAKAASARNRTRQGASSQSTQSNAAVGQVLPPKLKYEVQQQATKDELTLANTAIKEAQTDANKIAQHQSRIKRMLDMVQKNDIGNRLGKIPGGETALEMADQDYNEFNAHRNALIDILMKEGGSQLMNTLPELAIHSDAFPKISDAPDVNKRKMVGVANLADARLAAPAFLEQWAKRNGGSIDGAQAEFRQWMLYNEKYEAQDVNGKIKIVPNKGYIPLDQWAKEMQAGRIKIINGQVLRKR